MSTGLSVEPKKWNTHKQRVTSKWMNASTVNRVLDSIEHDLREAVLSIMNEKTIPNPSLILQRYDQIRGISETPLRREFFSLWDEWVEATSKTKALATLKRYKSVGNRLREYENSTGNRIAFDRIDRQFVENLTEHLRDTHKLQNSSVWNIWKAIKTFMGWARDRDYTSNTYLDRVRKTQFSVHDKHPLRLTHQELNSIINLDLSATPHLSNVRDLFVLQCYLGIRYADLEKVVKNPLGHMANSVVTITTSKNKRPLEIPIVGYAESLCSRIDEIHAISNQKANLYLKEIAELAGLKRKIIVPKFRGAERVDEEFELRDLITTHIAKKTFSSTLNDNGVPQGDILELTGNTQGTIGRYLSHGRKDLREKMTNAFIDIGPEGTTSSHTDE